jgi:paxillin
VGAITDPVTAGGSAAAAAAASGAGSGAEESKDADDEQGAVDLRAEALSAAMHVQDDEEDVDMDGAGEAASAASAEGEGEGEAGDDDAFDDGAEEDDGCCKVCSEGVEGRDTLHVPGFGVCHHDCVACSQCSRHLSVDGDPSADETALRTGGGAMCYDDKLFCRSHFLDQFGDAICAGCIVPFRKGERVVEAVGRRWHPEHLVCEACSEPFLDGKCFGVDGLPYCTSCHTDLFLRCDGCGETVEESDDGLSALGKTWHRRCFVCSDCSCAFDDGKFYSRDGRPYCEEHYFENFAPKCAKCARPVVSDGLRACGAVWHKECFCCVTCGVEFADGKFMERDGQPYCEQHFLEMFGQRCGGCGLVIRDKYLQAMDQSWHPDCFVCGECGCGFDDGAYFTHESKPYCREHFGSLFCERCPGCSEPIIDGTTIKIGDEKWHQDCLRCDECSEPLDGKMMALGDPVRRYHHHCFTCDTCSAPLVDPGTGVGKFAAHEDKKLCVGCYAEAAGPRCSGCHGVISTGQTAITALGGKWHPSCFVCLACELPVEGSMAAVNGRPLCGSCLQQSKPCCPTCGKPVDGTHKEVLGHAYHDDCFLCTEAGCSLEAGAMARAGWPVCTSHAPGGDAWSDEAQARIDAWEAHAAERAKVVEAVAAAKEADAPEPPVAPAAAKEADAPEPPVAPAAAKAVDVNSQYKVYRDDDGDLYYVHTESGESLWEPPEGFDQSRLRVEGEDSTPPSSAASESSEQIDESDPNSLWRSFADEDGDLYYINQLTQESSWERPEGFTREPEEA